MSLEKWLLLGLLALLALGLIATIYARILTSNVTKAYKQQLNEQELKYRPTLKIAICATIYLAGPTLTMDELMKELHFNDKWAIGRALQELYNEKEVFETKHGFQLYK